MELKQTQRDGSHLKQRKSSHLKQQQYQTPAPELSTSPSMKGYSFSPFVDTAKAPRLGRIGVPGYRQFPQFWKVLFMWTGSSIEAIFKCNCTHFYMVCQTAIFVVFAYSGYPAGLRGAALPEGMMATFRSLTIFILTFFISQILGKYNTRFENVCKTNGFVTRLTALAAALYPRAEAEALMRYTNAIMHVYYLILSPGGMAEEKWGLLVRRGILTEEEVSRLQRQGSPGVVLYSWAIDILKSGPAKSSGGSATAEIEASLTHVNNAWAGGMLPFQLNLEACVGGTRGLAAKQIAYTLQQVPFLLVAPVLVPVASGSGSGCPSHPPVVLAALTTPLPVLPPRSPRSFTSTRSTW